MWDKAINNTDYQYSYGQGLEGAKPVNVAGAQSSARFAWGAKMDGLSTIQYDGNSYAYSPYKDNIANFYRVGPSLTNTVAVSGGGDKGTFRPSLSQLDTNSLLPTTGATPKQITPNLNPKN